MTILPKDYTDPQQGDHIIGDLHHPWQILRVKWVEGDRVQLSHCILNEGRPATQIEQNCSVGDLLDIVRRQADHIQRKDEK